MAKIKLGAKPKNFKAKVTFPVISGGEASIEVSFIYRTRKEFGAFLDSVLAAAGVDTANVDEGTKVSIADALSKTLETNADYIMQIADGWDLDSPFDRETVMQLCDEFPAAAQAIMVGYRSAMTEGRLGN